MNFKWAQTCRGFACTHVFFLFSLSIFLYLCSANVAKAQQTISGVINDENNSPIIGATVRAVASQSATVTDVEGKFSLTATAQTDSLNVSFIGFVSETIALNGKTDVRLNLKTSVAQLNEVVVTGYGKTNKRNITGAVTTISSEDFNQGVFGSPAQLLQGKVAGLNIAKSGDPTERPTAILRGPSTLRSGAAQEPFYVIDGVPGASIELVAPSDIASIDILKDASQTAIYGSRASNGVIIVTTKRSKGGVAKLSYDTYVGIETVSNKIDMLTGDELRGYLKANGQTLISDYDINGANTDWQKEVQRTGYSQNHHLAYNGASDKTVYGVSLNYFNNQGIIKTSSLDRIIAKGFVEQRFFDDKFKFGVTLVTTTTNQQNLPGGNTLFGNMLVYMPTVPVYKADGSFTEDLTRGGYLNPVALLQQNTDKSKIKTNLINLFGEVKILPNLVYTLSASSQNEQNNREYYYNTNSAYAPGTNGRAGRNAYENTKTVIESYLNYDLSFKKSVLRLLAGYSWQEDRTNDGFGIQTQGYTNDALAYNNLYLSNPLVVGNIVFENPTISTLRLISYYGRINYSLNDKYLVQASLRNDGSSAFGTNNQWGIFPAVSAGWRLSREKFLENVTALDELKFRVGYGVSGNSLGFDAFTSKLRYGSVGRYYSNGQLVTAIGAVQNENADLKWESTATTNVGLDFSFKKGRFSGSIDYYIKNTSDLIWDQYPVSTTQYFVNTITANVGKISNKGVELVLTAIPVLTKNFRWTSSFNIAHNENNVVSLSNDKFKLASIPTAFLGGKGQTGNWSQIVQEGYPVGTFNLWNYAGKDANGVSSYKTADGKTISSQPLTTDFMIPGNAQPNLIFGWNNTFFYKGFDLNFFFRGVTGNKILNNTLASLNSPLDAKNINMPRFTLGESYKDIFAYLTSDRYLESGSYLRLDNATFGYSFPVQSKNISRLRFYVSGTNIFTLTSYTGIDPEINIGGLTPGIDNRNFYPKTRSVIFGATATF